ncbi:glycoside hydrolase family 127 protein [Blautia producta]|uniref:glycoside hydrolase family 127 protein n=1 Tax=Blautia producta TaxID=33035 RepID=UPI0031B5ADA3
MLEKKMQPYPLDQVQVGDGFWKKYMELIRCQVIPYQWNALNDRIEGAQPSYCLQNFRIAAGIETGEFQGMVFQDSDVYKWLEAVSYTLMWQPDKEMEALADSTIDLICAAQQPDGYLDTYYIINGLEKRFTNLLDCHELYCLGHMVEGAVAYYKAVGKTKFLDAACRYANCVYENFGTEPGKIPGYPGHEIAEMALVSLFEVTGDERHLKLAKYFIDQRGQEPIYFEKERAGNKNVFDWENSYYKYQYYQAGKPVRCQGRAEGHAVRAVYLYTGMAEVASATEDKELFQTCEKIWKNIVARQMYITGGIGSSQFGEAFTFDYDLPNDTNYAETCAAIGLVFFARRMFEITKDSRYTDVMERALYNGVISGISLDGTKFFYVNPLEVFPEASDKDYHKSHVKYERQKWFGCACCPPNIARTVASIGGYAYEKNENEIYVNLFLDGVIHAEFGGVDNCIEVKTNYPWDKNVKLRFNNQAACSFTCAVRVPGWCTEFEFLINGKKAEYKLEKGYAYFKRKWISGDEILFNMEMPVRLVAANPKVREDIGKVAVMRGPVVYCLEEEDNGKLLPAVYLEEQAEFYEALEDNVLGKVITLTTDGWRLDETDWAEGVLYRTYNGKHMKKQELKFIPYYAWTNRRPGEMLVWVRI